jgi:hypothetical protein
VLPAEAHQTVSCGVGLRTPVESAYVARLYRGRVGLYLDRDSTQRRIEHLAAVVYTREAYLNDPDVVNDERREAHSSRATLRRRTSW